MKHKLRRCILYGILRISIGFYSFIPMRMGIFLGKFFGRLAYLMLSKERKKTLRHLETAGLYSAPSRTACKVFENLGMNAAEWFNFHKIRAGNIDRFVKCEGIEKIDKVLEAGRGVIMLTAHFGNWELMGAYFALKGYKTNVIVRRIYYKGYNDVLEGMRRSKGVNPIYRGESVKEILKLLRRNEMLGILPDQDIDSAEGVFVDFFGSPAWTPVGPVAIALASGAPIIPCYIRRDGKNPMLHRFVIEDPIYVCKDKTADKKSILLTNTRIWSKITESYIKRFPDQWVWMHRRWKTVEPK